MGRGIAVLHGGPRRAKGRGSFGGGLFSIFTMGNAIGSPTVNFQSPNGWANANDLVYRVGQKTGLFLEVCDSRIC